MNLSMLKNLKSATGESWGSLLKSGLKLKLLGKTSITLTWGDREIPYDFETNWGKISGILQVSLNKGNYVKLQTSINEICNGKNNIQINTNISIKDNNISLNNPNVDFTIAGEQVLQSYSNITDLFKSIVVEKIDISINDSGICIGYSPSKLTPSLL